ncbi:MAG: L,D-transpeptidase family protein [Hyphomicrobium sp.]
MTTQPNPIRGRQDVASRVLAAALSALVLTGVATEMALAEPAAGETAAPTQPATTGAAPESPAAAATSEAPAATTPAATPDKPAEAPAAAAAQPSDASMTPTAAPQTTNAVITAVIARLADTAQVKSVHPDDAAAARAFYAGRSEPVWVKSGAMTSSATAILATLQKAADYGLDPSAFIVTPLASGASDQDMAATETSIALAALKYARHARGGRADPKSISRIWDVTPEIKDPKAVLDSIAASNAPGDDLAGFNPKHKGFEALRKALLKARGPQVEEAIDPALLVKIPPGKTVKPGAAHADIALLRQRLKVPAEQGADANLLDAKVEAALKSFQTEDGMPANGALNARTRTALNKAGEPKRSDPKSEVDRIIVNLERWRWLPEDLGRLYVMNNIPEFMGRVVKGDDVVFEERIIVGLPTWPTPMLTDSMEKIVFNPEWGVPDGIKMKELLPRLKQAGGNDNFFDQLFGGGGSSGGARVLAAYGLKPSLNGRPVDANAIDWSKVDIRRFSFVQPAGGQNPLGLVKFMFPNVHDVYMHDTSQRPLFAQSRRALSHGCIRVENPRKLAELLLSEDKGWDADKVADMYRSSTNEVMLDKPVPVYLAYFTARVSDDGKLRTFADIYGHDGRVLSALAGRAVRYDPPDHTEEEIAAASDATIDTGAPAEPTKKSQKKAANAKTAKRSTGDSAGEILSNALSGLVAN